MPISEFTSENIIINYSVVLAYDCVYTFKTCYDGTYTKLVV